MLTWLSDVKPGSSAGVLPERRGDVRLEVAVPEVLAGRLAAGCLHQHPGQLAAGQRFVGQLDSDDVAGVEEQLVNGELRLRPNENKNKGSVSP